MTLKELTLRLQRGADGLVGLNIPLTTVNHRNITKTKRDDTASENVDDIGTRVPVLRL